MTQQRTQQVVHWTPRLLGLAFAAFLAIFALDVFTMRLTTGERVVALLMHLIPTGIVLLTLALVWRREWIGAVVFPLLAVAHLVSKWGQLDLSGYAIIEAPLLVIGAMYLASWRTRLQMRASHG